MASKRRLRRKSCTGKRAFESEAEAKANNRFRLRPYKCTFCSLFHLGHTPKKIRQAVAARRGHIA